MNYLICTFVVGVVATAVMDLWGWLRKPLFGIPAADYRLVGRWVLYLARGRFQHESIAASPALNGEVLTGWIAHYLLGLVFAVGLLFIAGQPWIDRPTPLLPLVFGAVTVLVPFLLMQPAMGLGVAASRTLRPRAARIQSLITHVVFGLGLFAGGWAAHFLSSTGD